MKNKKSVKKKFYVVWKGRNKGIFTSWEDCSTQVSGFKGAEYKSFNTLVKAEEAFKSNSTVFIGKEIFASDLSDEELKLIGKPVLESIAVDGAWNSVTGIMEYKGVYTETGKILFKQGPFKDGTNNVGEFLAVVHGLAYLKKIESFIPVYTDSSTAITWVKYKKCNSRLEKTERNKILFDLIERAERWLWENKYENEILKWETRAWGEIPADFNRK
ncbi:MAG TPA: ribonuclease H family protein [Candidatus Eremiobacteraeota bacterium]|nr:MAG: Ribonuclease H [bacterium ADurb.Bin363]HPZ06790.1 ribonuclease H family protein [Candidatus Eremiobacteraeota bacterium]